MKLNEDSAAGGRRVNLKVRPMQIDDLAGVFHLGESLFKAAEAPNLYRTWDEFEVVELFNSDAEFCLVAEVDDRLVGFALGNTITKTHSAWKYGHLIWLGVTPSFQRLGVAERALCLMAFMRYLLQIRKWPRVSKDAITGRTPWVIPISE